MADGLYTRDLDILSTWAAGTFQFLLLKGTGYTFNPDHDFVSDLTPASNEAAGVGYARVTAATKTRTVDDTNNWIAYDCDNPAFGSIAAGETITAMVLFRFVTNDAASPLIAYYDLGNVATDGAAFTPSLNATGLLKMRAA